MTQVAKTTGKTPKELQGDEYPVAGTWLWNLFWTLNTSRSPDTGIPYSEIHAYSLLMGITFSPWEVDVIRAMDVAYSRFIFDKSKR